MKDLSVLLECGKREREREERSYLEEINFLLYNKNSANTMDGVTAILDI